ncbi:MAG: hypothetical protein R3245_12465 [Kiloniellales bacterium]|nr:hypothetical protein [Kiloniellales bacterium]
MVQLGKNSTLLSSDLRRKIFVALFGLGLVGQLGDLHAQEDDPYSPWRHETWRNAPHETQRYVCDYAQRPPAWCAERPWSPNVYTNHKPEVYGPSAPQDEAQWLRLRNRLSHESLSSEDVSVIRRRALIRKDPEAMEIMGYLHAEGLAVPQDLEEAYVWYGRSYLAGRRGVKENMDILWARIVAEDMDAANRLKAYFAER